MTGIMINPLDTVSYKRDWLNKLQPLTSDSSKIHLRVLYYDEFLFLNAINKEKAEATTSTKFTV